MIEEIQQAETCFDRFESVFGFKQGVRSLVVRVLMIRDDRHSIGVPFFFVLLTKKVIKQILGLTFFAALGG